MIHFLFSLNIVWGILCVILYLLSGVDPHRFWLFSISSLIIPISFAINVLFIFIWLFVKWRYGILSLLILLLGYGHIRKFFSLNEKNESSRCQTSSFRLMSFNLYGLKNTKDPSEQIQQSKKSQFLSFIRKTDPDILCVQENNLFSDRILTESGIFPYVHYMINHGTGIYSRYPILDQGLLDFGKNTNSCVWADIMVNGNRIRVYSTHLESNRITREVSKLRDDQPEESKQKVGLIRDIFRKYRRMSIRRAEQANMIREHASQSPYPVVIAGDFNDTPYSYSYRILTNKRKDSFLERGFGIGTTYMGLIPGLRIDFILADEGPLNFCTHRVSQTPFSDHNPIMAEIFSK